MNKIEWTKRTIIILTVISLLGTLLLASAVYVMTSNSVVTSPMNAPLLSLTQDKAAPVVGVDSVNYTATCSDHSFAGLITFKNGAVVLGSVNAVAGVAVYNYVPTGTTQLIVTASAPYTQS